MKRGGEVHTLPRLLGSGWFNIRDGRVVSKHRFKYTAVARGRQIAREAKVEHAIHRRDGRITAKNSYGNDPRKVPG